jgi:SAM-dependent methyltransferase
MAAKRASDLSLGAAERYVLLIRRPEIRDASAMGRLRDTSRDREEVFADATYADACMRYRSPPDHSVLAYVKELRTLLGESHVSHPVILDVGCGAGTFVLPLARLAGANRGHLIALDRSPVMIQLVRRLVFQHDAESLITACVGDFHYHGLSEPCALIWASDVVHLMPDLDAFSRRAARLLAPSGAIAIRMSSHDQLKGYEWGPYFPDALRLDLEAHHDTNAVRASLTRSGFEQIRVMEVDESRWMSTRRYLQLFEARYLSSLRLIEDRRFAAGMRRMKRACQGSPRILRDGRTTLIVGRRAC